MKKTFISFLTFFTVLFFVVSAPPAIRAVDSDYYDLAAESITLIPASPAANQDVVVTVKIKNAGTKKLYTSAGANSYSYQFDDFYMTKISFTPPSYSNVISAGDYLYYIIEGKFLSPGEKNLSFSIDTGRELNESNEDNNSISKKAAVVAAGGEDLAVGLISLSADKPIVNTDVTITVTVKNAGSASITDSLGLADEDILITFSGFTIKNKTHSVYPATASPLDPGAAFTYTFTGQFSKMGANSLSFQIDRNGRVKETNENNNSAAVVKTIYLNPEEADTFSITGISVSPVSSTSVMVAWTTDGAATGKINYKENIYESLEGEVSDSTATTTHSLTLSGLKNDKVYYYRIVAVNGSVTKDSGYREFKTPANDNLSITAGPSVERDGAKKLTKFSWTANLISSGYVYYKKQSDAPYFLQGVADKTLDHEIKLENLPDGQYLYYVTSSSTPGTIVKSAEDSFEISDAGINTENSAAPSAPSSSAPTSAPANQTSGADALPITNQALYNSVKGKIIIRVESKGEAYYVHPQSKVMYFLGRPADAFRVMRERGIGISNANLNKISIGLSEFSGTDTDKDGLPDALEDALGTNKNVIDSDGDGFPDKTEIIKGYSPLVRNALMSVDAKFVSGQKGKIFLQTESRGEAWYVNPADGKRYFLGRPADAFNVMRNLGLGIANNNFVKL